jgi:hypothetical protein
MVAVQHAIRCRLPAAFEQLDREIEATDRTVDASEARIAAAREPPISTQLQQRTLVEETIFYGH